MGRNISDEEVFTNINDLLNKHVIVAPPEPPPAPTPVRRSGSTGTPSDRVEVIRADEDAGTSRREPSDGTTVVFGQGLERPEPQGSPRVREFRQQLDEVSRQLGQDDPRVQQLRRDISQLEEIEQFGGEVLDTRKRIADLRLKIDSGRGVEGAVAELRDIEDRLRSVAQESPEFVQAAMDARNQRLEQPFVPETSSAPTRESTIAAVDNVLADIRRDGEVISQELGVQSEDGGLDYKGTPYHTVFTDGFDTIFPNGEHLFSRNVQTELGTNIPVPSDLDVPAAATFALAPVTMPLSIITRLLPVIPNSPFLLVEQGNSSRRLSAKAQVEEQLKSLGRSEERLAGNRLTEGQRNILTALDYTTVFSGHTDRLAYKRELQLKNLETAVQQNRPVATTRVEDLGKEYVIAAMEAQTHNAFAPVVQSMLVINPAEYRGSTPFAMSRAEVTQRGFAAPSSRNYTGLSSVNRFVSENYIGQQNYDDEFDAAVGRESQPKLNVRRVFSDVIRENANAEGVDPVAREILLDLEQYFLRTQPEFYEPGTPVRDANGRPTSTEFQLVDREGDQSVVRGEPRGALSTIQVEVPTYTPNLRNTRGRMPSELRQSLGALSLEQQGLVRGALVQAQRAGQLLSSNLREQGTRFEAITPLQRYNEAVSQERPVVNQINSLYANALDWDSATLGHISDIIGEENRRTVGRTLRTLSVD